MCPTVSWRMDEGHEMLLCNSWKASDPSLGKCSTRAGLLHQQNPQCHTWARDQAPLLLSTPFLRGMNSRNSSFPLPPSHPFKTRSHCASLSLQVGAGSVPQPLAVGLSITWHCCIPAILLGPDASICLWHNEGLLCVLALRRGWKPD